MILDKRANGLSVKRLEADNLNISMRYAEKIYGTENNPNQLPITEASRKRIVRISPDTLLSLEDTQGNMFAWSTVFPTTRALADLFCEKKITEKELFDRTPEDGVYDALYICSIITCQSIAEKDVPRSFSKKRLRDFR